MIKEFMKRFKSSEDDVTAAKAAPQEEEVSMTTETQAAVVAEEVDAQADATLTAQLATVTEQLTTLQSQFAEMSAKYEQAQAALNASQEAQAELAKQAAEKRLQDRTEAIKAAVGTDKVDALLAATDGMADEQFNVIVSAMAASFDAEAQTAAFQEAGVAAEKPVVDEKPTHFQQFIKKGN